MLDVIRDRYLAWIFNAGDSCPDCYRGQVMQGGILRECDTCDGLGMVSVGGGSDDAE